MDKPCKIPLLVIVGPTASGKTGLSIDLCREFSGEVISCDSMQVYRGMDIGTAKPSEAEKSGIPHHMMDILDPGEDFSVAEYCERAKRCIIDIHSRGKLPVLTGGTGLYIDSLVQGVFFAETEKDEGYREELREFAKANGNDALYERLREIDEESALQIHQNNLPRIIRALEIYRQTGEKPSKLKARSKENGSPFDPLYIGLTAADRDYLYERINLRVDMMLESGLLDEIKMLLERGIKEESTALQAIGYKEFLPALRGEISLEEAKEKVKQVTRNYAKRQLTWFKRNKDIFFINIDEEDALEKAKERVRSWRS